MKNVAIIDTTILPGLVALVRFTRDGVVPLEWHVNHSKQASVASLSQEVLALSRRRLSPLGGIFISVGPGSFTGIKLGIGFVEGIKVGGYDGDVKSFSSLVALGRAVFQNGDGIVFNRATEVKGYYCRKLDDLFEVGLVDIRNENSIVLRPFGWDELRYEINTNFGQKMFLAGEWLKIREVSKKAFPDELKVFRQDSLAELIVKGTCMEINFHRNNYSREDSNENFLHPLYLRLSTPEERLKQKSNREGF